MPEITIPYTPRYPEIHEILDAHRFTVLVAHRRFGKTVLAVNHLLRQALICTKPRGCYGYVGPLLKQAKKVAWDYLKSFTKGIPGRSINESELRITLPNEASIWIYGADNPDSMRGSYFDGVVMDEVAQMKPQVWGEIVQPMLADRKGWAVFIGTPKGVNLFSELYYSALQYQQDGNADWAAMLYPVTKTRALDPDEIERLRRDQSENQFRQEFLCDFTVSNDNNLISMADVMDAMERHISPDLVAAYPVVIGVDVARFGDDATVFFARQGNRAYEPVIVRNMNNVDVAHLLVGYIQERKPRLVCIDQGQGTGIIDLVRGLVPQGRPQIVEVPFGSRANNEAKFVNRRAEMWSLMKEWIKSGALPNRPDLQAELTAPEYSFDVQGRIRLEPKEQIKKRLKGKSTDLADALALTFAVPMGPYDQSLNTQPAMSRNGVYDPFAKWSGRGWR